MCASGGRLVTASSGGSAERRVPPGRLQHFVAAVARAEGVPGDQAETFAARMVEADLRGMHGHGVVRLAPYVRRMREGGYTLRPKIRALRETPVSALVEGDNGLGQVVMTFAVETAIAKARESGLAWGGGAGRQPRRGRGRLCGDGLAARPCRGVPGGGEREPHGALGRARRAAEHEPDRHRDPGGGDAVRAGYGVRR